MAVDVPLRQTAEQAADAFRIAGELGKGFAEDRRKGSGGFARHAPKFRELWRLLAETLPELNREPLRTVEQACRELATCLHNVRGKLSDAQRRGYEGLPKLYRRPGNEALPGPESYTDYAETLTNASKRGTEALRSIQEPRTLAGRAFELSDSLGKDFLADVANPTQFARYRIPYGELFEILLDLREPIEDPPPEFAEFAAALLAVVNAVRNVWRVLPESERQELRESRVCLRNVGSPREATDGVYAEFGPELSTAAATGFAAMRSWQAKWQTVDPFAGIAERFDRELADEPTDEGAFIEALLAGPVATELPPRQMALLKALIKRPLRLSQIQREKLASGGNSHTLDRLTKLRAIRDFNLELSERGKLPSASPRNGRQIRGKASDDAASHPTHGGASRSSTQFTLLAQYPETPAGHVAFVEWFASELRGAAKAKASGEYSDETITSMLHLKNWHEAKRRLDAPGLPDPAAESVRVALQYPLNPATVEHVARRLTPAVENLRDAFQENRAGARLTESVPSDAIEDSAVDPAQPLSKEPGPRDVRPPTGKPAQPGGRKGRRKSGTGRPAKYDVSFVAALTSHHGYENGYCKAFEPIDSSTLRKAADDCPANAVTRFFDREFKGAGTPRKRYVAACRNRATLVAALMRLNQESPSAELLGIDLGSLSRDDD